MNKDFSADKGMVQVQLRPWSQRTGSDHTSWAVSERINEILADEHEAESFAMSPGMIDGYGRGGGFELSVINKNGQDLRTFFDITQRFVEALNRRPEVSDAYSGYAIDYPQYRVDVDASRCKKLGVSPSAVLNELSAFLGSSYVSNFNKYNQVYQVTMQLRPTDRADLHSLDRLFVRSDEGAMLPVSQFVTLRKEYMPQSLSRFNMVGSIGITGSVAQSSSTGDAIRAIREVAQKELPMGYGIEFSGITREESQTGSNVIVIFLISVQPNLQFGCMEHKHLQCAYEKYRFRNAAPPRPTAPARPHSHVPSCTDSPLPAPQSPPARDSDGCSSPSATRTPPCKYPQRGCPPARSGSS